MDFDDIVIGSGLAALGAVMGLEGGRRVLVIAGPSSGAFSYYDPRGSVPCAYSGQGGLGNSWHGVIPTGLRDTFAGTDDEDFRSAFAHFYPRTRVDRRLGSPALFVPWRAIRPREELQRIAADRKGCLMVLAAAADRFTWTDRGVRVRTADGAFGSRRLWLAAGALHTPDILERSVGRAVRRPHVSDHVFCYLGHADGLASPRIERTRDGLWLPSWFGTHPAALYTIRPARFAFRTLDFGIEQRAVFGMPTGSAMAKIARRLSPGLLAEALFNRFGMFPSARRYSVYAQVLVRDAYQWQADPRVPLRPLPEIIRLATDSARADAPFDGLRRSARPDLHLPGIHLHHSLDRAALRSAGIDEEGSPVQVVDASTLERIGPEHHSFKMLLAARARARRTGTSAPSRTDAAHARAV